MTQTTTQNDKKNAAPPVTNGNSAVEPANPEDSVAAIRASRKVFVIVTRGENSGEIFVFKNIKEAETFLNFEPRAPKAGAFEVIFGHLQETKQRVSLR
jgi:hypothetical protein